MNIGMIRSGSWIIEKTDIRKKAIERSIELPVPIKTVKAVDYRHAGMKLKAAIIDI